MSGARDRHENPFFLGERGQVAVFCTMLGSCLTLLLFFRGNLISQKWNAHIFAGLHFRDWAETEQ